jgi:hypothetical protein
MLMAQLSAGAARIQCVDSHSARDGSALAPRARKTRFDEDQRVISRSPQRLRKCTQTH